MAIHAELPEEIVAAKIKTAIYTAYSIANGTAFLIMSSTLRGKGRGDAKWETGDVSRRRTSGTKNSVLVSERCDATASVSRASDAFARGTVSTRNL